MKAETVCSHWVPNYDKRTRAAADRCTFFFFVGPLVGLLVGPDQKAQWAPCGPLAIVYFFHGEVSHAPLFFCLYVLIIITVISVTAATTQNHRCGSLSLSLSHFLFLSLSVSLFPSLSLPLSFLPSPSSNCFAPCCQKHSTHAHRLSFTFSWEQFLLFPIQLFIATRTQHIHLKDQLVVVTHL